VLWASVDCALGLLLLTAWHLSIATDLGITPFVQLEHL
jgi:hypothetical protein